MNKIKLTAVALAVGTASIFTMTTVIADDTMPATQDKITCKMKDQKEEQMTAKECMEKKGTVVEENKNMQPMTGAKPSDENDTDS